VGDSLAMCVLWIGFGARKVWGVDAFADPRDLVREKAIVESLLRSVPDEERARILATVDLRGEALETDEARLRYVANTPCERLLEVVPPSTVSVLYSLALLEHVRDLRRGLQALYAALRPGGEMIHQVDLRNHGVLDELGEGAFRRPSSTTWRLMGSAWGLPNREALSVYRDTLESLGAEVHVESEKEYEVDSFPEAGQRVRDIQDERAVRVFWLHARQPEPFEAGRGGIPRDGIRSASLP
jgi:SAM-dependent methyltransferase